MATSFPRSNALSRKNIKSIFSRGRKLTGKNYSGISMGNAVQAHFSLRIPSSQLEAWSLRNRDDSWEILEREIGAQTRSRGWLNKAEFLALCEWKSPRSRHQCRENSAEFVCDVTRVAFLTSSEILRIEILTLLHGVGWPTASTILHFCHPQPYPIIDFRALWTLKSDVPNQYTFSFWWNYTKFCRSLAAKTKLSMRKLDMALWQYSKENQTT